VCRRIGAEHARRRLDDNRAGNGRALLPHPEESFSAFVPTCVDEPGGAPAARTGGVPHYIDLECLELDPTSSTTAPWGLSVTETGLAHSQLTRVAPRARPTVRRLLNADRARVTKALGFAIIRELSPDNVTPETRNLNHAIYCASRGKALLDKFLLNNRNWDLPAARHVLFCGVSTRTVEKFWRLLEVLAAKHFRIESLPLAGAR